MGSAADAAGFEPDAGGVEAIIDWSLRRAGTVGWEPETNPSSIEKIRLFARD